MSPFIMLVNDSLFLSIWRSPVRSCKFYLRSAIPLFDIIWLAKKVIIILFLFSKSGDSGFEVDCWISCYFDHCSVIYKRYECRLYPPNFSTLGQREIPSYPLVITRWICEATIYIVICRLPVSEIDDIIEPDEHQSMPDTSQDTGAVTRSAMWVIMNYMLILKIITLSNAWVVPWINIYFNS